MASALTRTRIAALVLLVVAALTAVSQSSYGRIEDVWESKEYAPVKEFSWSDIEPSKSLVWKKNCYPTFECARLEVPLNYSDTSGASAAIALIRVPSKLPASSPDYRGPILFNPGGPGGSGVSTILLRGHDFAEVIGPQFDIVGFDPRGIQFSTPGVSFYHSNLERVLLGYGTDVKDSAPSAEHLSTIWAKAQNKNNLAALRAADVIPFIHTDHTARDMLSIVEAHGRDKLQYWGFSYGTLLGNTFASMFPDKIERLVVDGVVDADDYYATDWYDNLVDTDKALSTFFESCVDAGPDSCAFYAPTAEQISQNLTTLYEQVREQPIRVPPIDASSLDYGVIDYPSVQLSIFRSLYSPFAMWQSLAFALARLVEGDGRALFDFLGGLHGLPGPLCQKNDEEFRAGPEVQDAILCNDGAAIPNTLDDTKMHYERLANISSLGNVWARIRTSCSGWPRLAKDNFRGPVGAKNTSFPILLIGNDADPVTPHAAAEKMSKRFPGSRLLSQEFAGHCSISSPSVCTQNYIREYFVNGTLPPEGTWCPIIGSPFLGSELDFAGADGQVPLNAADAKRVEVARRMARTWEERVPFLFN